MLQTRLAIIAAAGVLGACAAPQVLQPLEGEDLVGRRVAVTTHAAPALDAGKVGDDLAARYGINDPAAGIGRGLALSLVTERDMTLLLDSDAAEDADYVIDVQTLDWALDTYPTAWNRYRLKYGAQLRLISRADGRLVAESTCRVEQGDDDHPPTRDDLVADEAALIKGYLNMAAAACIDVAARETLRLRDVTETFVASRSDVVVPASAPASAPEFAPESVAAAPRLTLPAPVAVARPEAPITQGSIVTRAASADGGADRMVTRAPPINPQERMVTRDSAPGGDARMVSRDAPRGVEFVARSAPVPAATAVPRPVAAPVAVPAPTPIPTAAPTPRPIPTPTPIVVAPAPQPAPIQRPSQPRAALPPATPDPRQAEQERLLRRDALSDAARASGQAIVLLQDTPFRDSPRAVAPVTANLPEGTEAVVRQRIYNADGEWWFIAIPGDIGWIRSPDPVVRGAPGH